MVLPPTSNVRVRPFMASARETVLALAPRLLANVPAWRDAEVAVGATRKWISQAIDQIGPGSTVLVAEDGAGACVGFVTIQRETHWTGEEQAYVPELVVAEAAEGTGVGCTLMAGVEAWARERGLRLIELDTSIRNSRSRAFYARLGFAEDSVKLVKVLGDERGSSDGSATGKE